jgi:hypothetical protein
MFFKERHTVSDWIVLGNMLEYVPQQNMFPFAPR